MQATSDLALGRVTAAMDLAAIGDLAHVEPVLEQVVAGSSASLTVGLCCQIVRSNRRC
jgi:hypothetical protein